MGGAAGALAAAPALGPRNHRRAALRRSRAKDLSQPGASLHSFLHCMVLTSLGLVGWVFGAELCCIWKLSIHCESLFLLFLFLTTHMASHHCQIIYPPYKPLKTRTPGFSSLRETAEPVGLYQGGLLFLLFCFVFWNNYRLTINCNSRTERSSVPITHLSPMTPSYVTEHYKARKLIGSKPSTRL